MNYVWAFVVGGGVCVIGALLLDYTKLTPARILTLYCRRVKTRIECAARHAPSVFGRIIFAPTVHGKL